MTENSAMSVAIIGGGLAGLATAAYLGRAGHRVTLFERSETLGGRGGTTEHNGYLHNFGPHALYRGSTGLEVLRELGISFTGGTPDVAGVAIRRGRPYTLPTGARTMLATRLFGVRARVEAGRQMLALRKITGDDRRTVREWLDHEFEQPAARELHRSHHPARHIRERARTHPRGRCGEAVGLGGRWCALCRWRLATARAWPSRRCRGSWSRNTHGRAHRCAPGSRPHNRGAPCWWRDVRSGRGRAGGAARSRARTGWRFGRHRQDGRISGAGKSRLSRPRTHALAEPSAALRAWYRCPHVHVGSFVLREAGARRPSTAFGREVPAGR